MGQWKEWIDLAIAAASLAGILGAVVLAWIIAMRYRLPQLECRVKALEDINTGTVRTLVHKNEIYKPDGELLYMRREDCDKTTHECADERTAELSQLRNDVGAVRAKLDAMEEARDRARRQMIGFMAAVKEKLSLKFTIPDD